MPLVNLATTYRALFGIVASNPFSNDLQVALLTSFPDESNPGLQILEPVVGTYARAIIDKNNFQSMYVAPYISYSLDVVFPSPSSISWGILRAWALVDDGTASGTLGLGSILYWDKLLVTKSPEPNVPVLFKANDLRLSM